MGKINLRNVGITAPHALFRNLDLVVGEGDRLGLIAGNGGGKSTLLRCIAGLAEPSEGEITRSRGMRIGFVEQDMPPNLLELTLHEAVRRALPPIAREDEAWRVDMVLGEFDTPAELFDRPVRALSGGWQRLALIARAWITEPDALLLDEPTNHLDLGKIQMLEAWLCHATQAIPVIVASHDRQFLDAATNRTLFLRPQTSHVYAHPFTRARALLANDDAAQENRLAKDSKEADRLRRSAAELKNIGINSRSDLAQRKAMLMAKRADKLEATLRPVHNERAGDIRLANRGTHAKVLVAMADVLVATPDGTRLFRIAKLDIFQHDRIVLMGRNGVGKSQLVRRLRHALEGGEVAGLRASPTIVLGYIDQQMSQLPADSTPHDFISASFRLGDQRSLSLLAGAGFPPDFQQRRIALLSPGQRARLGLLALRLTAPNFYLMDEPTNHVDITGQERLEAEILEHRATCVLVSHDRSFVQNTGTRFLLIEGGKIVETDGPVFRG